MDFPPGGFTKCCSQEYQEEMNAQLQARYTEMKSRLIKFQVGATCVEIRAIVEAA
jgi:hypothetical protein